MKHVLIACLLAAAVTRAESVLQFPVVNCTVVKGAGLLQVPVLRDNDLDTVATVTVATLPGSASPGIDYTPILTNLTFLAGETNHVVLIAILNHGLVGAIKQFQVTLSQPLGGTLGRQKNLTVNIWNNNKGLHFYNAQTIVNEDAGVAIIQVARGDDGTNQVSVQYATTDGTAKAGQDYTPVSGTLLFEPGQALNSFRVPIANDALPQPNRSFTLSLSHPGPGAVLGTGVVTTVILQDTDRILQLDSSQYFTSEEAAYVQIGITQGENDLATSVDLTTADGVAKAGRDYVALATNIAFNAGERLKYIRVPLLRNPLKESSRTLHVGLSNPANGARLGPRATATVTIADDDPGVGFAQKAYSFAANADSVRLGVTRGGGDALRAFSVDYRTVDLSAQKDVDYGAVAGTLCFAPHQTLAAINIPIMPPHAATGQRSFKVLLSNVAGGPSLGLSTVVVTLCNPGNYYPVAPRIQSHAQLYQVDGLNALHWTGDGIPQTAGEVSGPWRELAQLSSPYVTSADATTGFYRIESTRPAEVYVPSSYDGQTPLPLLLVLHGLASASDFPDILATVRSAFPLKSLAESRRFLLCYPIGTLDAQNRWFWNGPDFLSFSNPDRDDSGYLRALIEEIQRRFRVDPKRIYATGYSSGGAMCHRFAAENSELVAGIVSMAGDTYFDPNACRPTHLVNVLQIQGTKDNYLGGTLAPYELPIIGEASGPVRVAQIWAGYNGCQDPVVEAAPSLDVTTEPGTPPGMDATVLRYTHCPPGGAVELWTVLNGDHYIFYNQLAPHFLENLVDWLLAHPKP
jgi:polyhydroxybutyrate depolymerase